MGVTSARRIRVLALGLVVSAPLAMLAQAPPARSWPPADRVERNGREADLVVQVGDIDNLGFGWPPGFDPFSGRSTDPHPYPWAPDPKDAPATDRIMVVSGHTLRSGDGYTENTRRPANLPEPLRLAFDPTGLTITSAALQLFVDDFQAPAFGTRYQVRLDGRDAPDLAAVVNRLDQAGPIGKLLTVQILPEHLAALADGRLEITIDDPVSDVGDGFAIDFARLLINPKAWRHTGTVRGIATTTDGGRPLAGVLVSAGNVRQATTGADGRFVLRDVPAGLVLAAGSHPQYIGDVEAVDLVAGETAEVRLELEPNRETTAALARQLETRGTVNVYGIYFDTDQAVIKAESQPTLAQVAALLEGTAGQRLVIVGHTDAEGTEAHNQDLSLRRAQAVIAWLVGRGESEPVADNRTAEGRALSRRVEIRQVGR